MSPETDTGCLLAVFILEEQPAWVPSLRSRKRVRLSPKLHFTDPSLAAAALGAGPKSLEHDIRTAGFLFETLCRRDLCVYVSALGGTVHHYQDDAGLEDKRDKQIKVKVKTRRVNLALNLCLNLYPNLRRERNDGKDYGKDKDIESLA